MRVDPDALAEALEQFDTLTPPVVWPANSFILPIVAAARAFLEAPTAEWCSVHSSPLTGGVFHEGVRVCQYAWYSGHAVESCIAGRVRLVAELLDEEPTREEVPEGSEQPNNPGPLR